jgi:3'-phosphoadenosine 5'-phosphosulfate sulfotransferase
VMGLLALALACSGPSSDDAQAALCSNLATFQQSVDKLTNLNSYSTVGELKAARDDARNSFQAVSQANAAVRNAQVDALVNAYDDLQNAIGDLPDEATVQEAATSLQPQVAAVQSAREQVRSGVECP